MTQHVLLKTPLFRASSLLPHNCRFGTSGNNGEHQPAISWKRATSKGRAPKDALYFYSKPPIPTKLLLRLHDSQTYRKHPILKVRVHSPCGGSEPKARRHRAHHISILAIREANRMYEQHPPGTLFGMAQTFICTLSRYIINTRHCTLCYLPPCLSPRAWVYIRTWTIFHHRHSSLPTRILSWFIALFALKASIIPGPKVLDNQRNHHD